MDEEPTRLEILMETIKVTTEEFADQLPPDGDWEPMLFVFKEDDVHVGEFEMPPNGPQRERLFETVLPNAIKDALPHPEGVVMLVSTWFSDKPEEYYEQNIMPSESPSRREALVIEGVSRDQEISLMAEIKRGESHPELEWMDHGQVIGRAVASLRRAVWD